MKDDQSLDEHALIFCARCGPLFLVLVMAGLAFFGMLPITGPHLPVNFFN